MTTTTFTHKSTVIEADWCNDVDAAVYAAIGDGATAPTTATAVRTNIDVNSATDLASTANAKGASLIGLEDAAGNFAATDVEAALAEEVSNLASTANGKGASLIGLEDAAGNVAATDVEAAIAEIYTDFNLASDLASTANAKGASLIGVEDSGANFSSTTVEAVLAELADGIQDTSFLPAGTVVQVVNTQDGAVATGTTTIPLDDTIPQNTEGTQFMSLGITPKYSNSKLKIDIVFNGAVNATAISLITALFQDSTADALAASATEQTAGNALNQVSFTHWMTSGTTSLTTFYVRAGHNSGAYTLTFNGSSGGRIFGGIMASSITITEIKQ